MRVVSQDGIFDFPYEQIAVYRNKNIIYCRFSNVEKSANILGIYSMCKNAEKAMKMLRNTYQYVEECKYTGAGAIQPEFVFRFPGDNEVNIDEN